MFVFEREILAEREMDEEEDFVVEGMPDDVLDVVLVCVEEREGLLVLVGVLVFEEVVDVVFVEVL